MQITCDIVEKPIVVKISHIVVVVVLVFFFLFAALCAK